MQTLKIVALKLVKKCFWKFSVQWSNPSKVCVEWPNAWII